jgi:hypothetical protein
MNIRRTGFNTYHLTNGTTMTGTHDEAMRAQEAADGLSVFQLLQDATTTETGPRTMRWTGPNMHATITVQSRMTRGSGHRDDSQAAQQHLEHVQK